MIQPPFTTCNYRSPFFTGDHRPLAIVVHRSEEIFLFRSSVFIHYCLSCHRLNQMQRNWNVVENDILEECIDVLSTLREVIILNRKLKDMTMKSMKQCGDLAMVIERVCDKLNYAFAFIWW
ncbi:hypothetical protein LOK49_LG02G02259 [Camellia lanceoleosa]|uniref:Uncharacterized protein n=1 Tax=Camellia lanceoleosa TaxID=1840588 RepID=A0ACC0IUK4_9ERIC|nr:hypothetical protein LOK49_LG02G02259 [Camellia lanceoleosa]